MNRTRAYFWFGVPVGVLFGAAAVNLFPALYLPIVLAGAVAMFVLGRRAESTP